MIIINLKGGLGNQMFQYALGYCLSKKKGAPLFLDLRLMNEHKIKPSPRNVPRDFDLDVFGIEKKIVDTSGLIKTFQFINNYKIRKIFSILFNKLNIFCIYEKKRIFDSRVLENNYKNLYLDGLWQSEQYFVDYRDEILNLYNFDKIKNIEENISFIKKIDFEKSVCINVRRTDFLNNPEHNIVNDNFYKNAISEMKIKLQENKLNFYIFSDDLEWCKKNFGYLENKYFVDHSLAGYKFYNYLYLMSCFKNFIIPNSTFGWWGAWLSKQNNKIIMVPEKWSGLLNENLIDIVPNSWLKIKFL